MRLIIKPVSTNSLFIGAKAERDIFDAQGLLIIEKGKTVTKQLIQRCHGKKIFVIAYEWRERSIQNLPPLNYRRFMSDSMKRLYYGVHLIQPEYLSKTLEIVGDIIWEFEKNTKLNIELSQLKKFHSSTYLHSINVAILSTVIGLKMGYNLESIRCLAIGALLHDWGKLAVPREILNKPSSLTSSEFAIIKQHPVRGVEILKGTNLSEEVFQVIMQHHERWKGQGYPEGLSGTDIHRNAQIVAVADVFDALTEDRPYRVGLPPYHALEMIFSGTGTNFAPESVHAFRSSLVLYPEETIVTMSTGEAGIVIAVPPNLPTRPVVRIIFDPKGRRVQTERIVDLRQDLSYSIREIEFEFAGYPLKNLNTIWHNAEG